jgi:hypothetical protein
VRHPRLWAGSLFVATPFLAYGIYEALLKATLHMVVVHHTPPRPLLLLRVIRAQYISAILEVISESEYKEELDELARGD